MEWRCRCYLGTVQPDISDIDLNMIAGIDNDDSIKRAWELMAEQDARSVPVLSDGRVQGIVSITDIAKSYMDESDSHVLATARTRFSSIAETLNGRIICGDHNEVFEKGKVTIAASSPDIMEGFIEENDLVVTGNRFETHFTAIELGAKCLVMCQGSTPTKTIKKLAEDRGCIIISTPYDTFTTARFINQSIPVSFCMTHENLMTFQLTDSLEDVEEMMKTNRFHNFPVIDKNGMYLGLISRRRLLNIHRKKVILVDHNEVSQAVDGIERAGAGDHRPSQARRVRNAGTGVFQEPAGGMHRDDNLSDVHRTGHHAESDNGRTSRICDNFRYADVQIAYVHAC